MGDDYRLYIRDESGPFFGMGQNLGWAKSSKVEQSWAKSSKVEQSRAKSSKVKQSRAKLSKVEQSEQSWAK